MFLCVQTDTHRQTYKSIEYYAVAMTIADIKVDAKILKLNNK